MFSASTSFTAPLGAGFSKDTEFVALLEFVDSENIDELINLLHNEAKVI